MNKGLHLLLASAVVTSLVASPAFAQRSRVAAPAPAVEKAAYADPNLTRESAVTTGTLVRDPTGERPGTITVNTKNFVLYLSMADGQAMRYSVGVGREGFEWQGRAHVARKAAWPTWTPPADMLLRRPDLPRVMAGGINNPLGARALYLYNASGDTGFRIHGNNDPSSIGTAVSSGCVRMNNADVEDLYNRVPVGATVNVI